MLKKEPEKDTIDKIITGVARILRDNPSYTLPSDVEPPVEFVRMGEVSLSSSIFNAEQLSQILIRLLENPQVRDYLMLIENKKNLSTYTG